MNLYMSFDHETDDFVYMKIGLFPDSWLADLILLLADGDELGILDLPAYVPTFIESGTEVRDLTGGTYTTEEDLYLAFMEDLSISASPLIDPFDWLTDAICDQPVVAYSRIELTDESFTWPSGRDPATLEPNVEEAPNWFCPEGIDTVTVIISSRKSSSPFWTHSTFDYWSAYTGEYNCEGLPYNIHVTCNPGELSTYLAPTPYNEHGYWEVAGYYRAIQSNASTWMDGDLTYTDEGSTQHLDGEIYRPTDTDEPVIWYNLPEEEEPVPQDVMMPVLMGVGMLVDVFGLQDSPLGIFRLDNLLESSTVAAGSLFYLSSREAWPLALDSSPFAMDNLPLAA